MMLLTSCRRALSRGGKFHPSPLKLHPWLQADPKTDYRSPLTPEDRILVFLAGSVASGNLDHVARDWGFLPFYLHRAGLEIVLQTHLFAGFPRVVNALRIIRGHPCCPQHTDHHPSEEGHEERGAELCRQIYGDDFSKLRQNMVDLHPALDRWMVEHGYGRVLARSIGEEEEEPTLRLRELCVLAVLSGQNVRPQLISHVLGAVRCGATWRECKDVLNLTHQVWGAEAQEQCNTVWREMVHKGVFKEA